MDDKKLFKRRLASSVWGGLLVWWGLVIMIDPLTIAIGAMGTGLIFILANRILSFRGLPIKAANTRFGVIALVWGILDQVRHMLSLPGSLSFALLLVVIGVSTIIFPFFSQSEPEPQAGGV